MPRTSEVGDNFPAVSGFPGSQKVYVGGSREDTREYARDKGMSLDSAIKEGLNDKAKEFKENFHE